MKNLILAMLSLMFVFLVVPSDASAQDTKQNLSSLQKVKIETVQVPAFLSINVLQGNSLLETPSVTTPEAFKRTTKKDLPKEMIGDDETFAWPFPPTSTIKCCKNETCECKLLTSPKGGQTEVEI